MSEKFLLDKCLLAKCLAAKCMSPKCLLSYQSYETFFFVRGQDKLNIVWFLIFFCLETAMGKIYNRREPKSCQA
jgi:hypothetical protein